MPSNTAKQLIVTSGLPDPHKTFERVLMVNEEGESVSLKTDAELASRYGFVASAPTGTDTTTLAAELTAATGSKLRLQPGTYVVTGLNVPAGTTLEVPKGSTLKLADAANTNLINITGDNVTIYGHGTIDGNRANQSSNSNAIYTTGGNTLVEGVRVKSANGYNIVGFPGATNLRVIGCYSEDARDEAIEFQGVIGGAAIGNIVKTAGKNGIYVYANTTSNAAYLCRDITIADNIVSGCSALSSGYAGIRVDDRAQNVTVIGNTVTGGGTNAKGIVVQSSTAYFVDSVSVVGNTVRSTPSTGIYVAAARGTTITGNTVNGTSDAGVYIHGSTAKGTTVNANTIIGCSLSGILLLDASDWTICGNVCVNNGQAASANYTAGITVFSSGATCDNGTINGNRCYDDQGSKTQQYGVRILNSSGSNVSIGPNALAGNGTTGLAISGGATCVPWKLISNQSISAAGNSIAHGLPYTPQTIMVFMRSAGTVNRAGNPDGTYVVLQSDSGTRTCDILVG